MTPLNLDVGAQITDWPGDKESVRKSKKLVESTLLKTASSGPIRRDQ